MKDILNRLINHETFCSEEAKQILINISEGMYNQSQIASFLTVFMMRSITLEELSGFRDALLDLCVKIDLKDFNVIDIVGTGGTKGAPGVGTLPKFGKSRIKRIGIDSAGQEGRHPVARSRRGKVERGVKRDASIGRFVKVAVVDRAVHRVSVGRRDGTVHSIATSHFVPTVVVEVGAVVLGSRDGERGIRFGRADFVILGDG